MFTLEPIVPCPSCGGEGIVPGPRACRACGGIGKRARNDVVTPPSLVPSKVHALLVGPGGVQGASIYVRRDECLDDLRALEKFVASGTEIVLFDYDKFDLSWRARVA